MQINGDVQDETICMHAKAVVMKPYKSANSSIRAQQQERQQSDGFVVPVPEYYVIGGSVRMMATVAIDCK